MREIKFRMWNATGENMLYDIDNVLECLKQQIKFDETMPDRGFVTAYDHRSDGAVWMQFTGLKDKDGREVYDGDILRFSAESDWDKINYSCFEVFFHDGDANSDYNIGYSMNRMHNHGSVCGGYIPSFKPKQISKMEIIGNIHESPELLA